MLNVRFVRKKRTGEVEKVREYNTRRTCRKPFSNIKSSKKNLTLNMRFTSR